MVQEQCGAEKAVQIILNSSGIDPWDTPALSTDNQPALDCILRKCAGLLQALGFAGSSTLGMMDPCANVAEQDVFVNYWEKFEANVSQLGRSKIQNYKGLFASVKLSLSLQEKK